MRIRVLGGGWYGCHIAKSLMERHYVELHEISDHLFAGASGGNPARLHLGFHYPRSKLTRAYCQVHQQEFMQEYGQLTRHVQSNIYAIASHDSLVDFGTYEQLMKAEVECIKVHSTREVGLYNVEGALLTGERHIVIDLARQHFEDVLGPVVKYGRGPSEDTAGWDWTIDCTFCNYESAAVDRYEPCVTGLYEGPTDRAVTIMDGPFPSLYPWNEDMRLNSLTSAKYTPFSKECRSYGDAAGILATVQIDEVHERCRLMEDQMASFWPHFKDKYKFVEPRFSIRAMPRSAADARIVDVSKSEGNVLRVRAGKIDAIIHASRMIKDMIKC